MIIAVICATCRYREKDTDCRPNQVRCRFDGKLRKANEPRQCDRHSVIV